MSSKSPRSQAIAAALAWFDSGALQRELARRVAFATESQDDTRAGLLEAYLDEEIGPCLARLGFATRRIVNPAPGAPPFLVAERHEADTLPTVLMYGHGDVVRGDASRWSDGLSPWRLEVRNGRWYGRGSADNKGQHSINLAALERVLVARGSLGINVKWIFEMGEEVGSPGLREVCRAEAKALAADVFIASDGPRLTAARPTLFLGSRGAFNFDLIVALRAGAHHSGNWGGLLANPGIILAHAIASLVDARGTPQIAGWQTPHIPASVRRALAGIVPGEPDGPPIDPDWGEPGLTPAERVFASNTLEVLAFTTGNPERPVNAIPADARAHLQLRFVAGTDVAGLVPRLRTHLDAAGFAGVRIASGRETVSWATRLDPEHPWVHYCRDSLERTTGATLTVLPNLGGSLPNDCFADGLGLPTLWVPHSYPACNQHAPDEHLLAAVAREGLAMMVGLFWDLGSGAPLPLRS